MKVGYLSAIAAVLVGGGWLTAQTSNPEPGRADNLSKVQHTTMAPAAVQSTPNWSEPPVARITDIDDGRQPFTVWTSAGYLLYHLQNGSIPDLSSRPPLGIVTVNFSDRILDTNGNLINRNVNPMVGFFPVQITNVPTVPSATEVPIGSHNGFRLSVGAWADTEQTWGVEASGYYLEERSFAFNNVADNQNSEFLFNTPFVQNTFTQVTTVVPGTPPITTTQNLLTTTTPIFFVRQASNVLSGTESNQMWGGEINLRRTCFIFGGATVGGLAGFRYQDLREKLDVNTDFAFFNPNLNPTRPDPVGSNLPDHIDIFTRDAVHVRNNFYGTQVGGDIDLNLSRFFFNVRGKVALGVNHEAVNVGSTTTTSTFQTPGAVPTVVPLPGGLLFSRFDVGNHNRNVFECVPELNVKAGFQCTNWLRIFAGYDLLYMTDVVRAGTVSTVSTFTTTVTAGGNLNTAQPTFRFTGTSFTVEGFTFGAEITY